MIPAQEVQQAMADQPAQFALQAVALLSRLAVRCLNRNDDVSEFKARGGGPVIAWVQCRDCLLYTSDAADE